MNSGGIQPHDLKFFDSEKKMAVAHYGKTPGNTRANLGASITFLEIVSGKVLQTVDAPGGNQELCHISISNEGNYIVSTQDFVNLPALANGSVKPSDLKLRQQHYPAPIIVGKFGEAPKVFQPTHLENHFQFNFSIAHDFERGIAAIAHINGKYVSFWNVRESRFLKGHALEDMVAGMELSADKSIFIASAPSTLYFFSASTFKKIGAVKLPTVASAPHILMLPEQV